MTRLHHETNTQHGINMQSNNGLNAKHLETLEETKNERTEAETELEQKQKYTVI